MSITIKEWLKDVYYDDFGQYLWSKQDADGGSQMIGEIRGWGALQNIFKNDKKKPSISSAIALQKIREYTQDAAEFQKEVGKFIADAINEKVRGFKNSPLHDKQAIMEMMDELHPEQMFELVEFIKKLKNEPEIR